MIVEECELQASENFGSTKPSDVISVKQPWSGLRGLNPGFLISPIGVLKFLQIVTAGVSLLILVHFRVKYILVIGYSLKLLFRSLVSGMLLSTVLSLCYTLSTKSYNLVRATIFELSCNGLFAGLYLIMSVFLWVYSEYDLLLYHLHPLKFEIHQVLVINAVCCSALGMLYSIDVILCFVHYARNKKKSKNAV